MNIVSQTTDSKMEEQFLIEDVLQGAPNDQIFDEIKTALKSVGPKSIHRIIIASEDSQDQMFSQN